MRSTKSDFRRKSDFDSAVREATEFEERVYEAVRKIPRGLVVIYQEIAAAIGNPKASRAVGNALNKNPFAGVPCHRVVRSDGSIGGYARGAKAKIRILRREGVRVENGRVNRSFLFRLYLKPKT